MLPCQITIKTDTTSLDRLETDTSWVFFFKYPNIFFCFVCFAFVWHLHSNHNHQHFYQLNGRMCQQLSITSYWNWRVKSFWMMLEWILLVVPPLWPTLKYLNDHKIDRAHSFSPEDNPFFLQCEVSPNIFFLKIAPDILMYPNVSSDFFLFHLWFWGKCLDKHRHSSLYLCTCVYVLLRGSFCIFGILTLVVTIIRYHCSTIIRLNVFV